ncbi:hypothetical protein [Paraclostridium bifermentans]|uniref:hypothetical protein n=1 Tax=Paraclostridium bifermentans TaxID=1490 RepID=UPI00189782C9|nr:hypothetical protein [Paraclostridium bifermentans]
MSTKLYIFTVLITFMVSIGVFTFEIGQVHNYQSYVDTQIERNGGLTDKSIANINTYNEKNYKGKFTINSDQMNQKLAYGSIVNYQIVGKYKLLFLKFDTQSYPVNGSAISLVR